MTHWFHTAPPRRIRSGTTVHIIDTERHAMDFVASTDANSDESRNSRTPPTHGQEEKTKMAKYQKKTTK